MQVTAVEAAVVDTAVVDTVVADMAVVVVVVDTVVDMATTVCSSLLNSTADTNNSKKTLIGISLYYGTGTSAFLLLG